LPQRLEGVAQMRGGQVRHARSDHHDAPEAAGRQILEHMALPLRQRGAALGQKRSGGKRRPVDAQSFHQRRHREAQLNVVQLAHTLDQIVDESPRELTPRGLGRHSGHQRLDARIGGRTGHDYERGRHVRQRDRFYMSLRPSIAFDIVNSSA
jgi:hypothetical protein